MNAVIADIKGVAVPGFVLRQRVVVIKACVFEYVVRVAELHPRRWRDNVPGHLKVPRRLLRPGIATDNHAPAAGCHLVYPRRRVFVENQIVLDDAAVHVVVEIERDSLCVRPGDKRVKPGVHPFARYHLAVVRRTPLSDNRRPHCYQLVLVDGDIVVKIDVRRIGKLVQALVRHVVGHAQRIDRQVCPEPRPADGIADIVADVNIAAVRDVYLRVAAVVDGVVLYDAWRGGRAYCPTAYVYPFAKRVFDQIVLDVNALYIPNPHGPAG